jgi:hypothetical protein
LLAALQGFELASSARIAEQLHPVLIELQELQGQLSPNDNAVIEVMEHLVTGFVKLCNWAQASVEGQANSERFLEAAHGQAVMASECVPSNQFPVFSEAAQKAISLLQNISDLRQVRDVASYLQRIPIPVFQLEVVHPWRPVELSNDATESRASLQHQGPFVIKAMFDVDRKPWSTPQILLAGIIYDLDARLTTPEWPDEANYLLIDYVTTLHPDHYRISPLQIERPKDDTTREFSTSGHIEFPVAQSLLGEPIVIRVRATFLSTSNPEVQIPATIVGYHELRVKVSDKTRTPLLARYRSIDARNYEMIEGINRSVTGLDQQHLADFVEALGAVTNYLGFSLQQAHYGEGLVIKEQDFQGDLLRHLRTLLGEDVQEAPKQGGGPTDIQYRTVTIELKVEKEISDRRKMAEKYVGQTTQYSSAGGAQLGILCILDLTEKHSPPASPQNQITLETPHLHGFDESEAPFPTKIAMVVVDGNLRWPSNYSR